MRRTQIEELGALLVVVLSGLLMVAVLSFHPADPSPFHASSAEVGVHNLIGQVGAFSSATLLHLFGIACLAPLGLCAWAGWRSLRKLSTGLDLPTLTGWFVLIVSVPAFLATFATTVPWRGGSLPLVGMLGEIVFDACGPLVGGVGRTVLLAFLVLCGLVLVSGLSTSHFVEGLLGKWSGWRLDRHKQSKLKRRERDLEEAREEVVRRQISRIRKGQASEGTFTVKRVEGRGRFRIVRKVVGEVREQPETTRERPALEPMDEGLPLTAIGEVALQHTPGEVEEAVETVEAAEAVESPGPEIIRPKRTKKKRTVEVEKTPAPEVQEKFDFVEELDSYTTPPLNFLDDNSTTAERDTSALIERGEMITAKCHEFKVKGEVVKVRTGPVITTYEFRLHTGVKISQVQKLSEDLALALRVPSVRIERVPGRATVGIEVPNPKPDVIALRDLFESPAFARSSSPLTLALGVDLHGDPFVSDLQRMPHLLIGGFTGAGKSVGINAMVMSILYKARPEEVKFIFVDPKMVELGIYAKIPHLLTPIITDPQKAANALGWAVAEMEDRYRCLASIGVRNIGQYNELVKNPALLEEAREHLIQEMGEEPPASFEPMPFIVIVIDELADLMMASGRAVEESIARIAQKARAVGIHLICATQRPSVDVLTGMIKANFPCRIAYKVRSKYDSRTILDAIGAEHLLGRGDMLYLPPGTSALKRLHGPLVTEKEIHTVTRYLKRQGKPQLRKEILDHAPVGEGSGGGKDGGGSEPEELSDSKYDEAARLVVTTRKASASYIQRRMRLGYTRAARLVDMMERDGLVGPLDGSKGREVLVPPDYFDELKESHELNEG